MFGKPSALAIAKLYSIIPEGHRRLRICSLELVYMLADENPMVVSNCAAAILEINRVRAGSNLCAQTSLLLLPWMNAVFTTRLSLVSNQFARRTLAIRTGEVRRMRLCVFDLVV
jgi:vesicle coat complex subunit